MAATDRTTQIRKGRKFDQVLEGARMVFLRAGFEGASVDDIAREAGVSKATLYSYFPDKRLLFMEVAKAECQRQADEAVQIIESVGMPVEEVLRFAAARFIDYMSSDFGLQTYRLCVAESDRFPQLGHAFYHSGPELVRSRMVEYLRKAVARGELVDRGFRPCGRPVRRAVQGRYPQPSGLRDLRRLRAARPRAGHRGRGLDVPCALRGAGLRGVRVRG